MASGDTLPILTAHQAISPASAGAPHSSRNLHPIMVFDDTTNWSTIFTCIMPQNYAATTGVTVYLHYSMATATADTVDWDVSFERIGDQQLDVDGDSFAAVNSVDNTTVPGTAGLVDVVNVPFTAGADMDSVVKGELFRLKVTRDAVSDDATGNAELHAVEIRET